MSRFSGFTYIIALFGMGGSVLVHSRHALAEPTSREAHAAAAPAAQDRGGSESAAPAAPAGPHLELRPHAGVGTLSAWDGSTSGAYWHAGGRVLLSANQVQNYGIEVTHLDSKDRNFLVVGVILEQKLWRWFLMSIGTVGYVKTGHTTGTDGSPFGIVSNLGWEPSWPIVRPFVTYRAEWIFSGSVLMGNSVSVGATLQVF